MPRRAASGQARRVGPGGPDTRERRLPDLAAWHPYLDLVSAPDSVPARLARLRGCAPPRHHTARTIAALTANPGCTRRAVLDAAGVDKAALADRVGHPARFGQSPFAIARGNAFEAQAKADDAAVLVGLLRPLLDLPDGPVTYVDLAGDDEGATRVRHALAALVAATCADGGTTLLDHPLLALTVAGSPVHVEPDLVVVAGGRVHVVEIKSFAIVDGQAPAAKVTAAATQAGVYALALREALAGSGLDPDDVAPRAVLVCPENFANRPTAVPVDVRRQVGVLRRQLSRLASIESLLAGLPADLTFDLAPDDAGRPTRPGADIAGALAAVPARYAPDCLSRCELAAYCRHEARGSCRALGPAVHEDLGGVDTVAGALALAEGDPADADQAEAAALLRLAAALRAEALAPQRYPAAGEVYLPGLAG